MNDVVFFAFEFSATDLRRARDVGFKVYQLMLERDEFVRRNEERLKTQPDNDAFRYVEKNLAQQEEL